MIRRMAAGLLGGLHAFNGLFMLMDGQRWFRITPGAASTGPFNAHFVADVAVAFIAAGLGLLALSWRIRYWPAALAGAVFLVFHALIHIVGYAQHPHDLMPTVWIAALAVLALGVAIPAKQMRKYFIRRMIQRMGRRYDYDPSYLLYLLDESPKAFWKFMRASALSRSCERSPVEATFTVRLLATIAEDCGPCTQLLVHHAREAKMATDQIEAVLTRNLTAMNPAVGLAYRYADAILNRRPDADDAREAVRSRWGSKGLIDLALSMQGARLYPMIKNALGYAVECQRVQVEGSAIEIRKQLVP